MSLAALIKQTRTATDELNADVAHGEQGYGAYANMRWCAVHGWHGFLYVCEHYSADKRAEVKLGAAAWRAQDERWYKDQVARGMPLALLEIFRRLARTTDATDQKVNA